MSPEAPGHLGWLAGVVAGLGGGDPPRQAPEGHLSRSSPSSASFSTLSEQVSPLIQRLKTGPREEMLVGKDRGEAMETCGKG